MTNPFDKDTLDELAITLASRIKKQRDKWVESFYQLLYDFNKTHKSHKFTVDAALPVVSAFQTVHVMSFIHSNKYIKQEQIGEFIDIFTESLYEGPRENLMQYLRQYQSNKEKDIPKQLSWFCEDVAMAIIGSHEGMLYGPGFVRMAMEFLYKNWGIAADHFGDASTLEECVRAVDEIRNNNGT